MRTAFTQPQRRKATLLQLGWGALVLLLVTANSAYAQGRIQTIYFYAGVLPPGTDRGLTQYRELDMRFYGLPGEYAPMFGQYSGSEEGYPCNGTQYIGLAAHDSLGFARTNGQSFGLVSVDLAEYSTLFQTPKAIPFVGYRPDGSTVKNIFTTDGIIDGLGPREDFQTFYFDSRFDNVVKVEVYATGFMMDNLVVKPAVPEPQTWALLALGGAAMLLDARRRRRRF